MELWLEKANAILEYWGPSFHLEWTEEGLLVPVMLGTPPVGQEEHWARAQELLFQVSAFLLVTSLSDSPEILELARCSTGEVGVGQDAAWNALVEQLIPRRARQAFFGDHGDSYYRTMPLPLGGHELTELAPRWERTEPMEKWINKGDFDTCKHRMFGTTNPERVENPYYEYMIRSLNSGYYASQYFGYDNFRFGREERIPCWCAQRYGQSTTFQPNGDLVLIAGEHEDSYDPDFCIYNDVIIWHADGTISLYFYPKEVFPCTDFHTATRVGDTIIIVGNLGYHDERKPGPAPVFQLDLNTMHIQPMKTAGDSPPRLHSHVAWRLSECEIAVLGGTYIVKGLLRTECFLRNHKAYALNVRTRTWRELPLTEHLEELQELVKNR